MESKQAAAFGNELQAHVLEGGQAAVGHASQAALNILEPFQQQHPEMAQFVQPLIDALRTGTPESIQFALNELGKMPGPAGEIGRQVSAGMAAVGTELPGATKTGVEGAIQELGGLTTGMETSVKNAIDALNLTMVNEFEKLIKAINNSINKDIKQDPSKRSRNYSQYKSSK